MTKRHLAYAIAFDPPGSVGHRALAKMLASSLLKTYFDGDIIVFRNSEAPLFLVERKGLEEVYNKRLFFGATGFLEGFGSVSAHWSVEASGDFKLWGNYSAGGRYGVRAGLGSNSLPQFEFTESFGSVGGVFGPIEGGSVRGWLD